MAHKKEFDFDNGSMPIDLLMMILINLPVKSLIRFTCVCKSWLRLIRNDVQFAITHYVSRSTLSACLMENSDYIVFHSYDYLRKHDGKLDEFFYKICVFSLTEKKTFREVKKFVLGLGLKVSVSNFCHGIMCIHVTPQYDRCIGESSKLILCNPLIREVVEVPVSLNIKTHEMTSFGIGYDSVCNDYKIVATINAGSYSHPTWVVDIFSISNRRWCSMHDLDILPQDMLLRDPVLNSKSSILNWNCGKVILSFDMVDEKFSKIPMPNCLCQKRCVHDLLTACHVKACLCCYSYVSNEDINIWVLTCLNVGDKSRVGNNPVYSWVKQVSIRFPDLKVVYPVNLWMNDNELLLNVKDDEDLFEICSYDLRTQQLKRTGRRGIVLSNVCAYTKSLVSIKSIMSTYNKSTLIEQDGESNMVDCEDNDTLEHKNNDGCVYFIREVAPRSYYVRYSYNFKLV